MPAIPDEQDGLLLGSAITIIIEDGTIVADANSYVSVNELIDYAMARNVDLSGETQDILSAYLIVASDHINSYYDQFKGLRVDDNQELEWPRQYVSISGNPSYGYIDPTIIPDGIKEGQMQLAMSQFAGVDLNPVVSEPLVTLRQVGPIVTKYSDRAGRTSSIPKITAFDRLIAPYLKSKYGIAMRG